MTVETTVDGAIAVITLTNPPLNLNTLATIRELRSTCEALSEDTTIRSVIITGAGERAFSVGSDITEFADVRDDVIDKKSANENAAFTAIEELPQPTIAAIGGIALGGGAEIALACDMRIMADNTTIGFPEVNLGVFPGSGGIFRLPRIIGMAKALELIYTGEPISASEAHRIGLVNAVAPADQVMSAALDLARRIASKPALALSLIKRGIRASHFQDTEAATQHSLRDSHAVFTGPDIEEGISAFFEKRPPVFTAPRTGEVR